MSIRGTAKYHQIPVQSDAPQFAAPQGQQFSSYSQNRDFNLKSTITEGDFADKVKAVTQKIEVFLDKYSGPVKPHLPTLGRFLIVVTFLEDALRILTQWSDQVYYITNFKHIPKFITVIFLLLNVVAMIAGSFMVTAKKRIEVGCGLLVGVIVTQALAYGLIFDFGFILRNLSVIGGLFIALNDAFVKDKSKRGLPGLPSIDDKDRSKYVLLAGRILLVVMFTSFILNMTWTLSRVLVSIVGIAACSMVVIGFKARVSAFLLCIILFIFNITANSYWAFPASSPVRDYLKYEHFQTLSIIGGLLLVVNTGAGKISIDEKKKVY
ncbi:ER-derived vesicles protein [Yarrowia sp. B02]|nr:ER-derived vesicles protein [Yarrowia sp. B02]